jgi:hypothetical protein
MEIGEGEKAGDEEENVIFFVTARKLNCEKGRLSSGPCGRKMGSKKSALFPRVWEER